jgi:hypothetical protein
VFICGCKKFLTVLFLSNEEDAIMKRTLTILMLTVLGIALAMAPAGAAPKKDGKPDGGNLNYGEYGRPATLDPSRAMR